MSNTAPTRRIPTSQVLFGALVVLLGVLLLLDSTNVAPTRSLLTYAPSLFVLVGLWAFVQSGFRNVVGPAVLVVVAGAWQLVALGYATVSELVVYWPVLVIAFGLSVVLGQYRSRVATTDDSHDSLFAAFGGVERRNTSKTFVGADLTAVFGGAELDLRDAELTDRPARVNVLALFGGAEVVVPRDWNVKMDVLPILAGASDDRPRRESEHDEIDLVVTGFTAFGGVSVTD
ncbi:Cell wall-active antibiotics response 4TMS YvqF [Halogeometricum rufum]|uniref:Cell wall-active antibiotics response 4TMS YvqF n=1 Tax=Halogeometricum rufum TaxID=553469 RepID=A0A1I6GVY8_9EURY|nr:LiaF domain-containing protein [Halogeometricum rufum]SFR46241.1 Cell wall-active antibiotics response 4TMS YvqF [Halogeometricum rufum]